MANIKENSEYLDKISPSNFKNLQKSVQSGISSSYVSPYIRTPQKIETGIESESLMPEKVQVSLPSSSKMQELPESYLSSNFLPGQKTPEGEVMWGNPSDKTVARNISEKMGGGQYALDPTQPGIIIKSSRGYEPEENKILRGGRSKIEVQIDHIIPLWLGGLDTLENKQVLNTKDHIRKTKAQAIPLTLLTQGKITRDEAFTMALNWESYNVDDLPMPDKFGMITNLPREKADELSKIAYGLDREEKNKAKEEYYKLLGLDDAAIKAKQKFEFDVQHPKGTFGHSFTDSVKAVWKEIPSVFAKFGENDKGENTIAGEFGKGLVMGSPAGLAILEEPEERTTAEKIAYGTGYGISTIGTLGGFIKGLTKTRIVLSKIPGLGKVFAKSPVSNVVKPLPWNAGLFDMNPIKTIAPELSSKIKIPGFEKVKSALSKINNFGKETGKISKTQVVNATKALKDANRLAKAEGNLDLQQIPMEIDKRVAARIKYSPILRNAFNFGSFGVAKQAIHDGLDTQSESDFMDYAGTFATEAIMGSLFTTAGQNLKGYAKMVAPALVLSTINGESPEDAFASAVTMVGLHGMGSKMMQKSPLSRDVMNWKGDKHSTIVNKGEKYEDVIVREMNKVADEASNDVLNKWAPVNTTKSGNGSRKYTQKELESIKEEALTNIEQAAYDEGWTPRESDSELLKALASVRQLDKGGMGAIIRDRADIADVKSIAKQLQESKTITGVLGDKIPNHLYETYGNSTQKDLSPVNFTEKPSGKFSATGIYPLTGGGSTINEGKTRLNIEAFDKAVKSGEAPFGDNVFLMDRGSDYKNKMEFLNKTTPKEKIDKGEFTPFKNPQNTVEAFGVIKHPETGENTFISLGFVARESRIPKMNEKVNTEGPDSLIEYNKFNNKDTLSQSLRDNGIKGVWGRILPLKTGLMTTKGGKSSGKQEYHLRVQLTDGRFEDSINTERLAKESNNPATPVVESVEQVPNKKPVVDTTIQKQNDGTNIDTIGKTEIIPEQKTIVKTPEIPTTQDSGYVTSKNIENTIVNESDRADMTPVEKTVKKVKSPNFRNFIMTGRGEEGVNAGVASIISDPKTRRDFTEKNITKLAKEVSNNGENINEGWPKFIEIFTNKIKKATGDDSFEITNTKDLRDLSWLYRRKANSGTRKEIILNKGGYGLVFKEGSKENIGQLDKDIKKFNKENGLPEDSMEIIHVGKNNNYRDEIKNPTDSRNILYYLTDEIQHLDKKGYTPLGIVKKGSDGIVFIKKEPKLVKDFDTNPLKYLNKGEKTSEFSSDDKFIRTFSVDVLGWPKDATAGDFVKRSNLNTHRYDVSKETGKVKMHILKAKTIGDRKELDIDSSKFEDPQSEKARKAVESFKKGSEVDGKTIAGEDFFDKSIGGVDYDPTKYTTGSKPLISGYVEKADGSKVKIIMKSHMTRADAAYRKMLKEEYGLDLGRNEIVTFDTNMKLGPKEGSLDVNISDIYFKPISASEDGRVKSSLERKFSSNDPKVTEDMLAETAKRRKDFEAFNKEAMEANTKEKLEKVIDKYAEKYNLDKDELFYGPMGESFKLGAARVNLAHNLEKISKNMFMETVLSDNLPNSGRLFYSPSIKLPIDGPNKPWRYVKDDEVVLGAEFMKKRDIKEGDKVMIMRDPSYDINNITVAKAINGTKLGHESLGREHAVVSHFNERVIHQADQDGDKMLIIKVGEGGVPESYANAVLKRGNLATPFTEVNVTKSGYVTSKNIINVIKNQLVGDDQTSHISVVNRVMDTIIENDLKIKIYKVKPGEGRSKYDIFSNGNLVESGFTNSSPDDFIAIPSWGKTERQLRSQALQEALDSKKSLDIVNRSEDNNPSWMIKQVFKKLSDKNIPKNIKKSTKEKETYSDTILNIQKKFNIKKTEEKIGDTISNSEARSIKGAMSNIQKIFNIEKISEKSKNLDEVFTRLKPSIELIKNIKESGGRITPYQEKWLSLPETITFRIPDKVRLDADKLGVKNVRESLTDIPLENKSLNQFIKLFKNIKKEYNKKGISKANKKELIKEIEDFFLDNVDNGTYTQEDIDSIARWAAVTKDGNISFDTGKYDTPRYVYRLNTIINASPKVAKAYLEASEGVDFSLNPETPNIDTPTQKYSNLTNTIKNNPN